MSRIEVTVVAGFRCDKRGCDALLELPEERGFDAWDDQDDTARVQGWSCWMTQGRSQRHYCPDHGPAAVNSMRRVW